MPFMFENLQVYLKAVDFADRIASLTECLPRGYYFLVDQLSRAALSIATNLAGGNGRFTKPDRRNFFTISRGSVQECVPLIEIARRRGFISDTDHFGLKSQLEEMAKMISGLINGLDKREV
jgi:four helix bundle protein